MEAPTLTETQIYAVIANERFNRFGRALDSKDWAAYQALYSPDGELILPGGVAAPQQRLAEDASANLGRFAATHHMITNVQAIPAGPRMTVTANLHAVHVYPDGSGKDAWVAVGRYDAELVLHDDVWLFRRVALTALWQQGDVPVF